MSEVSYIVLGGTGLIGSAVLRYLQGRKETVLSIHSKNYAEFVGAKAQVLVNCNGNTFRFRANHDPKWDFEASVATVQRSIFDFGFDMYLFVSTVDVYNILDDPSRNHEEVEIHFERLMPYAFHKWLAERIVERYAYRSVILRVSTALGPGLRKNPIYDLLNERQLYMSMESEISFIDTATIARCVGTAVDMNPRHEIFNVAGTGSVQLRDIEVRLNRKARLAGDAEKTTLRYNINNTKLSRIMPLPTVREVVDGYLASEGLTEIR